VSLSPDEGAGAAGAGDVTLVLGAAAGSAGTLVG